MISFRTTPALQNIKIMKKDIAEFQANDSTFCTQIEIDQVYNRPHFINLIQVILLAAQWPVLHLPQEQQPVPGSWFVCKSEKSGRALKRRAGKKASGAPFSPSSLLVLSFLESLEQATKAAQQFVSKPNRFVITCLVYIVVTKTGLYEKGTDFIFFLYCFKIKQTKKMPRL